MTPAQRAGARLHASDIHYTERGLAFTVQEAVWPLAASGESAVLASAAVQTALIGDYNVANVLAVLGGLRALGMPLAQAAALAADFTPVPGRMQRVPSGADQPEVVVDYAHTPDALDKSLAALRALASARGGRLWCVFGCGGNRDTSKRPLMGGIAARLADAVLITSDNPRHEDPAAIVAQVAAGVVPELTERVRCLVDRRAAIALALREADACDVVLIAGKGHEDYQEIAGRKWPFSDLLEAEQALAARPGDGA
jgi:UDP-N-acetylmuramoyl-L-alanyl-D-glutamate--2,6-diaminopimelate ligase